MNQSNIESTEGGLIEKSSERKIESPLDESMTIKEKYADERWENHFSNGDNLYVVQGKAKPFPWLEAWFDITKDKHQCSAELSLKQLRRGIPASLVGRYTDFRVVFRTVQEKIIVPSILDM